MKARRARTPKAPAGPDTDAAKWEPPGVRKDTPPRPVPVRVRRDRRQFPLFADAPAEPKS